MSEGAAILLQTLFWLSAGLLFHNYFGLLLLLKLAALFIGRPSRPEMKIDRLPGMTVAIAAYNEEAVIREKIENLLDQDYPADRVEVLVGSDLSTDRTDEIVRSYAGRNVRLVRMDERSGKQGVLDQIVPLASNDIVVITDANVILKDDALRKFAAAFTNPQVGAVSGNLKVILAPGVALQEESTYRSFEVSLKMSMSRFGALVGCVGGIYALRKHLYRPLGPLPISEDVIAPLEVLATGARVVFEPDAIGFEEAGPTMAAELRRRARNIGLTINSTARALRLGAQAGPFRLFLTLSYKILRWYAGFLFLVFALSGLLLYGLSPVHTIIATGLIILFAIGLIGGLLHLFSFRLFPFSQAFYFLMMNLAAPQGLYLYLRGTKRYWTPRGI